MALTRGRVLAGDAALAEAINQQIKMVMKTPRDLEKLAHDVIDMRTRLRDHQPQAGPFDIRRGDGGLVDIEFIAQTLQLAHAPRHDGLIGARALPQLLADLAQAKILDKTAYEQLQAASACFLTLRQIASLCLEDDVATPAHATASLVLEAINEPDMQRLHDRLAVHRAEVSAVFEKVMAALGG